MEFVIYDDENKEVCLSVINQLKFPYKVKVDNIYNKRSVSQNRYYHLIKKDLADFLGYTPKEMHNELLKMFALVEEQIIDDDVKYVVESTAGMNTLRMERFLEDIRRWALTIHGKYLFLPNEIIDDTDELKLKLI